MQIFILSMFSLKAFPPVLIITVCPAMYSCRNHVTYVLVVHGEPLPAGGSHVTKVVTRPCRVADVREDSIELVENWGTLDIRQNLLVLFSFSLSRIIRFNEKSLK